LWYLYKKLYPNVRLIFVPDQINLIARLLRELEALKEKQKKQDLITTEKKEL
jgi:hypothetical protein